MTIADRRLIALGIGVGVLLCITIAAFGGNAIPAKAAKSPRRHAQTRVTGISIDRLMRAFERIESGGRPQVRGDGGRSWGLYQFQRARWIESGGHPKEWGHASARRQRAVMLGALHHYAARMPPGLTTVQQVNYLGRCHNGGRRSTTANAYTRRLWAEYRN